MDKFEVVLICKNLKFFSKQDEAIFFEWIFRLDNIKKVSGKGCDVYLHVNTDDFTDWQLKELIALFSRYNVDMKQLRQLLTQENESWFCATTAQGFWHEHIFGEKVK